MPDLGDMVFNEYQQVEDNVFRGYEQNYDNAVLSPNPMVVSPELARGIANMASEPGSVFPIPQGSVRSLDEPDEFIWTSENGDRTPISKLEDSHLTNIIKLLSRNMVGLDEDSGRYRRNEETLILMRAERDKRNADRST